MNNYSDSLWMHPNPVHVLCMCTVDYMFVPSAVNIPCWFWVQTGSKLPTESFTVEGTRTVPCWRGTSLFLLKYQNQPVSLLFVCWDILNIDFTHTSYLNVTVLMMDLIWLVGRLVLGVWGQILFIFLLMDWFFLRVFFSFSFFLNLFFKVVFV